MPRKKKFVEPALLDKAAAYDMLQQKLAEIKKAKESEPPLTAEQERQKAFNDAHMERYRGRPRTK